MLYSMLDRMRSHTLVEYQGLIGHVEYDHEEGWYLGEIVNTPEVIRFHGATLKELRHAFRECVESHLALS